MVPASSVIRFSNQFDVTLIGSSVAILACISSVRCVGHSVSLVLWPSIETLYFNELRKTGCNDLCLTEVCQILVKLMHFCSGSEENGLTPSNVQSFVSHLLSSATINKFWKASEQVMSLVWGKAKEEMSSNDVIRLLILYIRYLCRVTLQLDSGSIFRSSLSKIECTSNFGRLNKITISNDGGSRDIFAGNVITDDFGGNYQIKFDSGLNNVFKITPKSTREIYKAIKKVKENLGTKITPSISTYISRRHQVAIVGAGAAALGAITALNRKGINDIVIIEGSSRVGGRVLTLYPANDKESAVELGAQWIHGQTGNCFYEEAVALDPALISEVCQEDGSGLFFLPGGLNVDSHIWEECWEYFGLREDFMENEFRDLKHSDVGEIFRDKMEWQKFLSDKDAYKWPIYDAVHDWLITWYLIDNACSDLHTLSSKHWHRYKFCEGERNICPAYGMTEVMHRLYSQRQAHITFNTTVRRVQYAEKVSYQRGNLNNCNLDGKTEAPVRLYCSDGQVIGSEHVIVTSSLGFLKNNPNFFTPALPEVLRLAVESMGYSTMNKIILEYSTPWWKEKYGDESIQIVWPKGITNSTLGKDTEWVKDLSGFDVSYSKTPRLTGWVAGKGAVLCERLSEVQIGAHCTSVLKNFLGRNDVPLPLNVYRSQWESNPLQCGTYSNPSVTFERNGCKVEDLSVPAMATLENVKLNSTAVPVVMLAGEANSYAHFSTVHGAFKSGFDQGNVIVQNVLRREEILQSSL